LAGISARQPDNSIKGAGSDRTGALDVRAQTEGALENLGRTLEEHGASLADVVDLTVFLTSMSDYQALMRFTIASLRGLSRHARPLAFINFPIRRFASS
jgi:enamine deaminase RidA (YjgF/YER057c/UK114 family)